MRHVYASALNNPYPYMPSDGTIIALEAFHQVEETLVVWKGRLGNKGILHKN